MAEYKNNSISQRDNMEETPEKKSKVVIKNGIGEKKKTLLDKVRESFTGSQDQSIGEYILLDVAVPMFKEMLFAGLTGALGMKLFGDSRRVPNGTKKNYTACSNTASYSTNTNTVRNGKTNVNDIPLRSRSDAAAVIDELRYNIREYKRATVADFMEAIGKTPDFTDNERGWTDISDAYISSDNYGNYYVILPRPRLV